MMSLSNITIQLMFLHYYTNTINHKSTLIFWGTNDWFHRRIQKRFVIPSCDYRLNYRPFDPEEATYVKFYFLMLLIFETEFKVMHHNTCMHYDAFINQFVSQFLSSFFFWQSHFPIVIFVLFPEQCLTLQLTKRWFF